MSTPEPLDLKPTPKKTLAKDDVDILSMPLAINIDGFAVFSNPVEYVLHLNKRNKGEKNIKTFNLKGCR